ncbi:MAG TPA: hypothetical protein DCE56_11005 [Cyanobacteria bacterium UBA8553]|nr:hypothetical protein [Cyanobacteria bacterium UBA8553]HAJ62587.1 hypothetical protein [Cyanobacteria bacterium UBA8543]
MPLDESTLKNVNSEIQSISKNLNLYRNLLIELNQQNCDQTLLPPLGCKGGPGPGEKPPDILLALIEKVNKYLE